MSHTFKPHSVVWITGASSGIGEGFALAYAHKGARLILSGRNVAALERVRQLCKPHAQVQLLPFDLGNYREMHIVVEQALAMYGGVDLLINNGGISQRSLIKDTSIEVDRQLMEVDYLGTVALSKALLPHFIARKHGTYAVITSLMGKFGSPYRSGYCAAKHALHGFFDVMRMEHEADGIQVTLLCPGFVNTNVARNALTGDGTQQGEQDTATEQGLTVGEFVMRGIRAIENGKFEAYIGKKEIIGVFLKRFFPKLLHYKVLKSAVR